MTGIQSVNAKWVDLLIDNGCGVWYSDRMIHLFHTPAVNPNNGKELTMPYNPEQQWPAVIMNKVEEYISSTFKSYYDGLITKAEALDKIHTITFHAVTNHMRVLEEKCFELIKWDTNKL